MSPAKARGGEAVGFSEDAAVGAAWRIVEGGEEGAGEAASEAVPDDVLMRRLSESVSLSAGGGAEAGAGPLISQLCTTIALSPAVSIGFKPRANAM